MHDGVDLCIDAVEEVTRACVWGLMADMNILVSEEVRLGSEFCV